MKLNLAIDQGNTFTKVSLFEGLQLICSYRYRYFHADVLQSLFNEYDIDAAIYSSVSGYSPEIENIIAANLKRFIILTNTTPMPMTIDYATPETLGHDRIAAAVGALGEMPGKDILIIDAGTALTLDIVTHDGHFIGGNITPGLKIRFESLHNYTGKLPLINTDGDIPLIGYDTPTAIRAGVVNGLIAEIDGYIRAASEKFKDLTVFMTGGDTPFLSKRIKSPIFDDENLLMKGLNRILLYNGL